MTEEQAALAAENIRLCTFAVKKHNDLDADWDDLIGIAYEALCVATQTWEGQNGCEFNTYAVQAIMWKLAHARKGRLIRVKRHVSLEAQNAYIQGEDDELDTSLLARMTIGNNWEDRIERQIDESRFEALLSEKERKILALLKAGLTYKEVSEQMGATRQYIQEVRNRIRKKRKAWGYE